jgi:cell division protein ZapA (FtsZ GTPase activity inhibitor)
MKVHISIRGRTYTLRTDEDEDLQAIARVVDRKMSEIASRSQRMDDYTVAMLTALNIASELERFRKQMDTELASLDRELASAMMLLESASQPRAPVEEEEGEDLPVAPETGAAET